MPWWLWALAIVGALGGLAAMFIDGDDEATRQGIRDGFDREGERGRLDP